MSSECRALKSTSPSPAFFERFDFKATDIDVRCYEHLRGFLEQRRD